MMVSVLPITYQSGETSFSQWIALFTLCLAPLIAHIAAGVPQVSILSQKGRPKWHERICHYNPTSILWRYAVITDRRIRSNSWDRVDMAAANTLFWTDHGWDGSEEIVEATRRYCVRLPESAYISLFSTEMIKSVIVTLQGVQAIVTLAGAFGGSSGLDWQHAKFREWTGFDMIFGPLAVIGLLRLPCSLWLTDEVAYSTSVPWSGYSRSQGGQYVLNLSVDSLLTEQHRPEDEDASQRPASGSRYQAAPDMIFPRVFVRLFFFFYTLGLWIIVVLFARLAPRFTVTAMLMVILYGLLFGATFLVITFYSLPWHAMGSSSTIVPCISSSWYKFYTGIVMGLMFLVFVISAIETRRSPCGIYTSYPGFLGDIIACFRSESNSVPMGSEATFRQTLNGDWAHFVIPIIYKGFGIAIENKVNETGFVIRNFTGMCLGHFG